MSRLLRACLAVFAIAVALAQVPAHAQATVKDEGVRVAGLWCYPVAGRPTQYRYLPSRVSLAKDAKTGKPAFSFLRYATDAAGRETGTDVLRADGGGILHFLVELETPPAQRRRAQAKLAKATGVKGAELVGPVSFAEGSYTLVSSVARRGDDGQPQALATGRAPVMEGQRIALSFDLSQTQAALLARSFETAAPDLSLVFDLAFDTQSPAYQATVHVDWDRLEKSSHFELRADAVLFGVEIERRFEALRTRGVIRIETAGESAASEALVARVYDRVLSLLFEPAPPEDEPKAKADLLSRIGRFVKATTDLDVPLIPPRLRYKRKGSQLEGTASFSLEHRTVLRRRVQIAFGAGDLHARYGGDPDHFRRVTLADPLNDRRRIAFELSPELVAGFEADVRHVVVLARKRHGSGRETLRELVFDRAAVARGETSLPFTYGWHDDGPGGQAAWWQFEFRVQVGTDGGRLQSPWLPTDEAFVRIERPDPQV